MVVAVFQCAKIESAAATGKSFTALTVMVKNCCAELFWPPLAMPPLSVRVAETVATPNAFVALVKVSVPEALMAG